MLIKANRMSHFRFSELMEVYASTNLEDGKSKYPQLFESEQRLQSEQDFYAYLQEFFKLPSTCCYILEREDIYVSALRLEPYKDGCLLTALETRPDSRNCGYGKSLVQQVLAQLPENAVVYSHIAKENEASIAVHTACGFSKFSDYAALLDGTVSQGYYTMQYIK